VKEEQRKLYKQKKMKLRNEGINLQTTSIANAIG